MQNVNVTVCSGLCCSCGICAAVCPVSCIHFERKKETYLPIIDEAACIRCGKCLKICPGYSYTYEEEENMPPICLTVYTKDEEILENASSGGAVTSMVQKLLQEGIYETAFLAYDYQYEEQKKTVPVQKGDSLKGTQQSRYVPVSQENAVRYILAHPEEKVIYVGTGCAVHGLCKALSAAGQSRENILIMGLFCDQTMTYSIYEYIKNMKKWKSPVSAVHFRDKRAGGWPGNMRIEFSDGTNRHISAKERMLVKDFCRLERCLYCLDKLNAEADISFGDNYTKKDVKKEGTSSIVIRTLTGKQSFEYCKDLFFTAPSSYDEIKKSQHLDKKYNDQMVYNQIFAESHEGKEVEKGVPSDLKEYKTDKPKAVSKDKKRLRKKLRELRLGEEKKYVIMRRKKENKRIKMYADACKNILMRR